MRTLAPAQGYVLACFADAEDEGRPATRNEVAQYCGYAHPSAVTKHVDALVRKGLLTKDRSVKRNIVLTDEGWAALGRTPALLGVPIVALQLSLDSALLAPQNLSGYLDEMAGARGRFAIQLKDGGWSKEGLQSGDYAIIEGASQAKKGDWAALRIADQISLVMIESVAPQLRLRQAGQATQEWSKGQQREQDVQVLGPLKALFRRL